MNRSVSGIGVLVRPRQYGLTRSNYKEHSLS